MKKLFLLIPAFLLSVATYANPIGPNDPDVTVSNALGNAISNASANAIIELSDGIYQEDGGFSIDKNITIQAAEGANPVIAQKYAFLIVNNAQVTFKGIKFDGGLYPVWGDNNDKHASDHCLRPYDASTGPETLTLDNCEFVNFPSYIIYAQRGNRRMDAITIRDCYFHDNLRSAVYVGYEGSQSTELACNSVTIENSTFANFTNVQEALISIKNNGAETDNIALRVDHCTFYNFVKNTDGDYSFIDCRKSTDVVISNCIFAQPDASMSRATYIYGGAINNCLTFNTNGHRSNNLAHNELSDTDPLFNDLANNKYTYAGEYGVSMSPARGAGTDGSDLGDPRWYTPVTYPSTDFAAPGYACSADAATIPTGVYGLSLYTESKSHYIICSSVAYNTLLGTWAITATRACYVTVGLDLGPEIDNNKHIFEVKILDKDGNPVGSLSEDPADPTGATENNTEANQLKTMDGSILIPAAGDYTIELRNLRGPGKGSIKNIILTYDGDAPITDFAAPGYTFLAKRAELAGNIEYNTTTATPYIQYTDNSDPGTATWIVTATRACQVKVAMNMVDNSAYSSGNGKHRFVVELLEGNVVKSYVEETSEVDENGRTFPRSYDMPGYITIPAAGDYTIRVRNPRERSRCGLASITLTYSYEGGDVINIATATNTTLDVADAWYSDCTRDNDKTYIQYPSSGTSSAWIKWNIATSETKYYDLTVNVNTTYAHGFTVAIYEDEEASPVASVTEGSYVNTKGDGLALEVGRVNLVGGKNYVVKVTNAPPGSQAKVTSVVFAPVVASSTALPNTLEFSNAVLSEKANITDGMLYFNEPGADKDPRGQWAQWSVTTDHEGLFLFTMGATSTNGQNYKITIKDDGDNVLDYYETSLDSGDKTVTHYFALSAGNYFVKVENTRSFSKGHLTSLVVTEPAGVVTIDESATDNTAWADKVVDKNAEGPLYDVQIIRSFKGGMNNTFCLPFAVSSSQCKEVFGNDVEIYTLGKATIEDYILNLTVNSASDIYPGTPVLIKPARDIVNPVFTDVKFTAATASATTKTNADFVGSFVKTPLTANDDLLYVGPENKVFFLSVDYDMPGMRAWFEIHDVPAALGSPKALRSARIIEKEQITTSILNVETSGDAARKVLYNGQIVIIRGNEMYNMQGQHIQ